MANAESERAAFEAIDRAHFGFLTEAGMTARGIRRDGAAWDGGFASRYESPQMRLDIGWSSSEKALAILLKYNVEGLQDAERYVYFEPLIAFLTNGREKPIVADVTNGMTIEGLEELIAERDAEFAQGVDAVAARLAEKLRAYLPDIRTVSREQILAYHAWMKQRA